MELSSGILPKDEYLRAVVRAVDFLQGAGIEDVVVAYGVGCGCPVEQPMRLHRLLAFIADSESAHFYWMGKDDLLVKASHGQAEFLFCHESDIHFVTEDAGLLERLKDAWLRDGYGGMRIRRGDEWEPVAATGGRMVPEVWRTFFSLWLILAGAAVGGIFPGAILAFLLLTKIHDLSPSLAEAVVLMPFALLGMMGALGGGLVAKLLRRDSTWPFYILLPVICGWVAGIVGYHWLMSWLRLGE